MIETAQIWWTERSARERVMLLIMVAALAATILLFAIIRPLFTSVTNAKIRHDQAVTQTAAVQTKAKALKTALAAPPPVLDGPVTTFVSQSATEAGFTLSKADPVGTDAVSASIVAAKSPAFFNWVDKLSAQGIFVDQVTIRTNSDATIAVDVMFKMQVR
jgi:general secretion pathway protein M